jgi:hypothetical protein
MISFTFIYIMCSLKLSSYRTENIVRVHYKEETFDVVERKSISKQITTLLSSMLRQVCM